MEKYEARKLQDLLASLRIHQTQEEDTGLYYCACWDTPCGNARLSWTKTLPCRHTWEHAWAHKLFRRYSHIVAHMRSHPLVSPSKRDLSAAQNFLLHVRTMSSRIRSWCFFFFQRCHLTSNFWGLGRLFFPIIYWDRVSCIQCSNNTFTSWRAAFIYQWLMDTFHDLSHICSWQTQFCRQFSIQFFCVCPSPYNLLYSAYPPVPST